MSDTPRVDALAAKILERGRAWNLARELEREIAAWQRATGCETPKDADEVICGLMGAVVEETVRADALRETLSGVEPYLNNLLPHVEREVRAALLRESLVGVTSLMVGKPTFTPHAACELPRDCVEQGECRSMEPAACRASDVHNHFSTESNARRDGQ